MSKSYLLKSGAFGALTLALTLSLSHTAYADFLTTDKDSNDSGTVSGDNASPTIFKHRSYDYDTKDKDRDTNSWGSLSPSSASSSSSNDDGYRNRYQRANTPSLSPPSLSEIQRRQLEPR